jgi:hypothetical protein
MLRFTRAFSKKVENNYHALALYFVWYNFVKTHKTLRMTPAIGRQPRFNPARYERYRHADRPPRTPAVKTRPLQKMPCRAGNLKVRQEPVRDALILIVLWLLPYGVTGHPFGNATPFSPATLRNMSG